jgi:hypothetical protein
MGGRGMMRTACSIAIGALLLAAPVVAEQRAPLGVLPQDEDSLPAVELDALHGGLQPGTDPFSLLTYPQVQRELDLSEAQLAALRRFNPLFREGTGRFQPGQPGTADAAREWTSRGAIANALSPAQLERLQQILRQVSGPCLLAREPELQRQVGLSAQQTAAIGVRCKALAAELRTEFRTPGPSDDRCAVIRANRAHLGEVRRAGEAAITSLLSPEQRQRFDALEGPPLTLDPRPIPGCRGDASRQAKIQEGMLP